MKIAILGCRGIPNNYGGFEQLAEYLSLGLVKKGHEVYVYSSDKHVYQEKMWKGIHILHQYDPEKSIGTIGQFVYDLNCILDSRKRNFDVILNLGYTSSSVWMKLFPKKTRVITNMDGMEWKRTKYSKKVQSFLMYAEKLAVKGSDQLVADSLGIQKYLQEKYSRDSVFIAYGTDIFENPNEEFLAPFKVKAYQYNMLIARMEPENNIEVILDGVKASKSTLPFFVVGNATNKFGTYLSTKFKDEKRIIFTGPIYKTEIINNLRYYSNLYFHGHSVGGTNPSLLEAMGCKALIGAHDNEFNKSVLGEDAFYLVKASKSTLPFFVVGNATNKFGTYLSTKFKDEKRIIFTGPIYKTEIINNLRYYSNLYFHGHSVGGTNPSLLEAMGCKALIGAHDNEFNKSVLGEDAFYFRNSEEVKQLIENTNREKEESCLFIRNNFTKILEHYSWEKIVAQYEKVMTNK